MMRTVQDYVNMFSTSAYLFKNGMNKKWMYFIPICEYDSVLPDENLKIEHGIVMNKGQEVVRIRDLIRKYFLNGDDKIFLIPLYFDTEPKQKIVFKTN